MSVLNEVHDGHPALQTYDLEDGNPRIANIVKRNGAFERILVTGTTPGVILIPIDTRRVIKLNSIRYFAQQIYCAIANTRIVYVRWDVVARGHATTFCANETVCVVRLVKDVLERLVQQVAH